MNTSVDVTHGPILDARSSLLRLPNRDVLRRLLEPKQYASDRSRDAISEYIEVFYNRIRRHSTIGNVSPANFEKMEQAIAA